jgi:hypothetical protein
MRSGSLKKSIITCLFFILLFSIFTVETNQDTRASFKERCPTCVDSNTVFIPLNGIDPSSFVNYVEKHIVFADSEQISQYKDLTNHYDRAPPGL